MEEFWSQNTTLIIVSLIFSILLTWFIGLLPVILIRYILIRKPLSRKISLSLSSFFWLVNILLFTLLGSESTTHVSLSLAALVSYYLYRVPKSLRVLLNDFLNFWPSFNSLSLFLWLRYLRKKKIVFLSIAAIALSVALLIVVDSLFTGYIEAMKRDAAGELGDVYLWSGSGVIDKYDSLLERLEEIEEVVAAGPVGFGGGLLWLESGDVREVMIRGIEPAYEKGFVDWEKILIRQGGEGAGGVSFEVPGYPQDDGCWLGVGIAAEPNEQTDEYDLAAVRKLIGKRVVLTTAGAGGKLRTVKLRIADVALTETFQGDKSLFIPLKKLNAITYGDETSQSGLTKIKLKERVDAAWMKAVIFGVWNRFAIEELGLDSDTIARSGVQTQQENMGDFFDELGRQKSVLLLIFGVICSVAVLLVFCIFYMIVQMRQKDIAIIKSCGATSGAAAMIFAGFGGCVGAIGSGVGIILGYLVTRNINTLEEWVRIGFGLKLWRSSSYMLKTIPNEVDWPAVLPIVVAAVAGSVLGALIPAIVAARTQPVKILRYE